MGLSFASKAANIQKTAVVTLTPHEMELKRLKDIINDLRGEMDHWKSDALLLKNAIEAAQLPMPEGLKMALGRTVPRLSPVPIDHDNTAERPTTDEIAVDSARFR